MSDFLEDSSEDVDVQDQSCEIYSSSDSIEDFTVIGLTKEQQRNYVHNLSRAADISGTEAWVYARRYNFCDIHELTLRVVGDRAAAENVEPEQVSTEAQEQSETSVSEAKALKQAMSTLELGGASTGTDPSQQEEPSSDRVRESNVSIDGQSVAVENEDTIPGLSKRDSDSSWESVRSDETQDNKHVPSEISDENRDDDDWEHVKQ